MPADRLQPACAFHVPHSEFRVPLPPSAFRLPSLRSCSTPFLRDTFLSFAPRFRAGMDPLPRTERHRRERNRFDPRRVDRSRLQLAGAAAGRGARFAGAVGQSDLSDQRRGRRLAGALLFADAADGKVLWQKAFAADTHPVHVQNSFASSSPAVDAEHVYVAWGTPDSISASWRSIIRASRSGASIWGRLSANTDSGRPRSCTKTW